MPAVLEGKRQNFNITPEQEAELQTLQGLFHTPSAKDTILRAIRLALVLSREVHQGKRLCLSDSNGRLTEVILPELESTAPVWTWLVERPHSWKKQLFVKGRKLTAAQVWLDMQVNQFNESDAMENWDLPREAIREIIRYCEQNQALIQAEVEEEKLTLLQKGIKLAP
jgi:hypothetical protein